MTSPGASPNATTPDGTPVDVLIVGYGPVGQTLAALLGSTGLTVAVCERRLARYETPRAGHFDHEIMRVFQSLGIAQQVRRIAEPARLYEFLDARGTVLSRLPREWKPPSGWDASYHFYQPELQDVLDAAARAHPNVTVRLGTTVVALHQTDEHVTATLANGDAITARYVVGADGASSAIRALSGIRMEDLGFRGDWLVVDVRPRPGAAMPDIPDTAQVLDPARPNHMGRVGQRYFRWEFMLVEGDDPAEMVRPERVWKLLAPWVDRTQAEVIRQTVYQFRSMVADTFRAGPVFLAGDAAHVMPPFLGQGMCSGIRDAATLAWMLRLVLTGRAEPALLDTYTPARRPQVLAYIEESIRVGDVVCETDPVKAARHREDLRSATELPAPLEPVVGAGVRAGDPLAGTLAVQASFRVGSHGTERSDDVLGNGMTLFALVELDAEARAAATELKTDIGLRTVLVGTGNATEVGDALRTWMTHAGVVAVLVRPDFYVFGSAAGPGDVQQLLADLRTGLSLRTHPPVSSVAG